MDGEEDYEGLSDEEIAAIKDEDSSEDNPDDNADGSEDKDESGDDSEDGKGDSEDDDKDSDKDESDKDDDSEDSDESDDSGDDDGKSEEDADDKEEDDESEESEEKPEATKETPEPFIPKLPGVDQAELDGLKTKYDEAQQKFDDGDIDYAALDKAKDAYNKLQWKQEVAEEQNQATDSQHWEWEQERFFEDNPQFSAEKNTTLNTALVGTVNRIIATEEGQKMSDKEVLQTAKKQVEKDLGITKQDNTDETEKKRKEALKKAKDAKSDRSKVDTDIGGLPTAEDNTTDTDEFAHLDRLEGDAYQNAVDALSPAAREKYENAA